MQQQPSFAMITQTKLISRFENVCVKGMTIHHNDLVKPIVGHLWFDNDSGFGGWQVVH